MILIMLTVFVACKEEDNNQGNQGNQGFQDNEVLDGSKGLKYTFVDFYSRDSYMVEGIGTCTDTNLVIPSRYKGLPVTSIRDLAFFGCTNLTSVTIPDSVTSIGSSAFGGCSEKRQTFR